MRTKKKIIILILSIVAFDLVTKLLTLNILPFQEDVFLIGDKLSLYLTFNEGSTGGQAGYLLKQEINKNLRLILNSIATFVLIGFIFIIKENNMKRLFKWFLGIGIYILIVIVLELVKPLIAIEISNWSASLVSKIAGISIYLTILTLIKNPQLKFFIWVVISAGLGNLLSHFYYPYRIIDFIYIEGSYELLRIGVFNFADLMFNLGVIGIFFTLILLIFNKVRDEGLTNNAEN